MNIYKLRFAPSPTGLLHAGNARVAIINWLMASANSGSMLLRIDDTDHARSNQKYIETIHKDLSWLNLNWSNEVRQSNRKHLYDDAAKTLRQMGRLYPCYETEEELQYKRRRQLKAGRPPIYDRKSLSLSKLEKSKLEANGQKPYFRFKLNHTSIEWEDIMRGSSLFEGKLLSDPILIRGDGRYLYHLPSCVDDLELGITHVIRGEDHVANTAIHVQIFQALGGTHPTFGHLPLMTDIKGVGLSKRFGSITLKALRDEGYEPLALIKYLMSLGSDIGKTPIASINELVKSFDIRKIGRTKPKFDLEQLWAENIRFLHTMSSKAAINRLKQMGMDYVTDEFWNSIKQNIKTFEETRFWYDVCFGDITPVIENFNFNKEALQQLPPEPWDKKTWYTWTHSLAAATKLKGRDLFLPLRKAITGKDHGPELSTLLPLIGRKKVVLRLQTS